MLTRKCIVPRLVSIGGRERRRVRDAVRDDQRDETTREDVTIIPFCSRKSAEFRPLFALPPPGVGVCISLIS